MWHQINLLCNVKIIGMPCQWHMYMSVFDFNRFYAFKCLHGGISTVERVLGASYIPARRHL